MKTADTSIWTAAKLKRIAEKYNTDAVYVCRKNGCDAASIEADGSFAVLPMSCVAATDATFNATVNVIQDMRRVAEKFGRIKDGKLQKEIRFSSLARAAQFVSAKHSARASDWKKVYIGQ